MNMVHNGAGPDVLASSVNLMYELCGNTNVPKPKLLSMIAPATTNNCFTHLDSRQRYCHLVSEE